MPSPYRGERPYPGKEHRMKDAAAEGLVVIVRCTLCKRTENFLAFDLIAIVGEDHVTHSPPFPRCSQCGTGEYLSTSLRLPAAGDYGSLIVRRPAGRKTTQMWASVRLGDAPPNLGDPIKPPGRYGRARTGG